MVIFVSKPYCNSLTILCDFDLFPKSWSKIDQILTTISNIEQMIKFLQFFAQCLSNSRPLDWVEKHVISRLVIRAQRIIQLCKERRRRKISRVNWQQCQFVPWCCSPAVAVVRAREPSLPQLPLTTSRLLFLLTYMKAANLLQIEKLCFPVSSVRTTSFFNQFSIYRRGIIHPLNKAQTFGCCFSLLIPFFTLLLCMCHYIEVELNRCTRIGGEVTGRKANQVTFCNFDNL